MEKDFKKLVDNKKDEIISSLQELIRIPSILNEEDTSSEAPFGKEIRKALDYMMNKAKCDGFSTLYDEGYAGEISYGKKNEGNKTIGILCHLDVVPVSGNWLYPPFDAVIDGNKLYGRGSGDDKGPTIAAYYALKIIKDNNIKLKNQIKIIFGTDEETGWRGISHYLSKYQAPDLGFVPDADFPLIYAEKGRMAIDLSANDFDQNDILVSIKGGERYNVVLDEATAILKKSLLDEAILYTKKNNLKMDYKNQDDLFVLTFYGKSSHAMAPENGINAGTYLCDFLKDYSNNKMVKYVAKYHHLSFFLENLGLDYNDYEMGPITCNIGIMDISKDNTRVTLDLRYPVRYDIDKFNQVLNEILTKNDLYIAKSTNKKPHYVDPNDDLVKLLYDSYVKYTSDTKNKPTTIGGGTYASTLPKAVTFGMRMPYEEELAHQCNEYINLDTLFTTILIYIDAIIKLGEIDA